MKKILFTVTAILISLFLFSQSNEVKLDLLRAPVSPASNLLGFATSDIDKPTDVSAFMLSLQSATSSFTKLPSNYAIDIAPYFLFRNRSTSATTAELQDSSFSQIFKQTFVISIAVRNPDSTETILNGKNTYTGLGFKFSIFRGKYDQATRQKINAIHLLQSQIVGNLNDFAREWRENNDPELAALLAAREMMVAGKTAKEIDSIVRHDPVYSRVQDQINSKLSGALSSSETAGIRADLRQKISDIASEFQTNRIGFSWDINGGISGEFINKQFDNARTYNAGLWTNFGYTGPRGNSFLGLIRYLYNPDKVFALDNGTNEMGDISTLDAGMRYNYSRSQSRFSASLEAIYRSVLSSGTIDPSWRLVFNADYALFENQKLTFSFGRNFDGTISKDGNLVAALTFLAGFGNKR